MTKQQQGEPTLNFSIHISCNTKINVEGKHESLFSRVVNRPRSQTHTHTFSCCLTGTYNQLIFSLWVGGWVGTLPWKLHKVNNSCLSLFFHPAPKRPYMKQHLQSLNTWDPYGFSSGPHSLSITLYLHLVSVISWEGCNDTLGVSWNWMCYISQALSKPIVISLSTDLGSPIWL